MISFSFRRNPTERPLMILGIDHVQLAMPAGGEDRARDFYTGLLGLGEVAKPPHLAVRGGCWFQLGAVQIHLGVEADFRPAKKAHPAFRVAGLDGIVTRARARGVRVIEEPGRAYLDDPFGNRIELVG